MSYLGVRWAVVLAIGSSSSSAFAGPPALPEDEAGPPPPAAADAAPPTTEPQPQPERKPGALVQPFEEPEGGAPPDDTASPEVEPQPEGEPELEVEPHPTSETGGVSAAGRSEEDLLAVDREVLAARDRDRAVAAAASGDADAPARPAMVGDRLEPVMLTQRGGVGLFHTALPVVGERFSFRFRLYTDFFRTANLAVTGDQHARVRGGVSLSFTPARWGEIFFSAHAAGNRNARALGPNETREPEALFSLGDLDFGFKGAHTFVKNGVSVGGQVGLGTLSGSERLLASNVNFWFDALFALDVRYLTARQFPFRFAASFGWLLDNSLRLTDYEDPTKTDATLEVTRFSLGANHNRLRMRYAVDFPVRLGAEKKFGIDPILEWSWDIATQEVREFIPTSGAASQPLPRSSQWLTIGLRGNAIKGLFLDAAVDIGLATPNYEFGPPVPRWQMMLALGYAFDPKPEVREVEVEVESPAPPPPPAVEGRILGRVIGPDGAAVPDAQIRFPGVAAGAVVTDASGSFTGYRFPAGTVPVEVVIDGTVVHATEAEVRDGEDTDLTIALEQLPAPETGLVRGTFTTASGEPLPVRMHVVGQGVDEPFESDAAGQIALELYAGDYRATLSAQGYVDKTVTFSVSPDGEATLRETLQPDTPPETPLVRASGNAIRLRGSIRYQGDDLDARSHPLLDQLATFLQAHSEIVTIRVGVHTDDRGSPMERSQARAEAVKAYLVSRGVSPERIEAEGYGDRRPLAVNLTSEGRARNNRTSISIVRRAE